MNMVLFSTCTFTCGFNDSISLNEAKVSNLEKLFSFTSKEDVGWFEISVDKSYLFSRLVNETESVQNLK